MSNSSLQVVMGRIKCAIPDSKIAVFRTNRPGQLDAVFESTVLTKKMIATKHIALIGVYDGTMDLQSVEKELANCI